MKEYEVAVILWEDHRHVERSSLPDDPDDLVDMPTLSVGLIIEETEKVIVLAHDIERYSDRDESTYTVILKATVIGRKVYGTIEIQEPRR